MTFLFIRWRTCDVFLRLAMALSYSALLLEYQSERNAGLMQPACVKTGDSFKGEGGFVSFGTQIYRRSGPMWRIKTTSVWSNSHFI